MTIKAASLLNLAKNHSLTLLKILIARKVTKSGKENRLSTFFTRIRDKGLENNPLGISNTQGTGSILEPNTAHKITNNKPKRIKILIGLPNVVKSQMPLLRWCLRTWSLEYSVFGLSFLYSVHQVLATDQLRTNRLWITGPAHTKVWQTRAQFHIFQNKSNQDHWLLKR